MGTLLGFALGFYLGAKAGPNGIDDLVKAWQTIQESEDFKALSATAQATLQGLVEQAGAGVANLAAGLMGAGSQPESARAEEAAGPDGALQGLVSSGAALVMQMLERGISAAQSRS
jgi:hypothetical protein